MAENEKFYSLVIISWMNMSNSGCTIKIEDPERGIIWASISSFYPLGKDELLKKDTINFNVKGKVKHILVNGVDKTEDNATLSCSVKFNSNLKIFSLVQDGWLPPTFSIPSVFLLDRNVLSAFENNQKGVLHYQENCWWFDFFNNTEKENIEVNTLFSALEGELQSLPKFDTFLNNILNYDEIVKKQFVNVKNTSLNTTQLRAIYDYISVVSYNNYIDFLLESVPLVLKGSAYKNKMNILKEILKLAGKYKLKSSSHLLILLISCLYESPRSDYKFARKILKPKKNYSKVMAHNCIFDVLFIDLFMFFKFYLNKDYSGITADRAVAVYWSIILPKINHDEAEFNVAFKFDNGLFEVASNNDVEYIASELKKL